MINVNIDGRDYRYDQEITLEEVLEREQLDQQGKIVAGIINNQIYNLNTVLRDGWKIKLLSINDISGNRIYRRSLFLVLAKAVYELFPDSKLSIEHSLSNGIYCELHKETPLSQKDLTCLKKTMRKYIRADLSIKYHELPLEEAREIFLSQGFEDRVALLDQLDIDKCPLYELDGYYDYFYYNMLPSTGYLELFDLHYQMPGFVILYPQRGNPVEVPEFIEQPKLSNVFYEYEKWGDIIGVGNVSELNKAIKEGRVSELIWISETLHEKKMSIIADKIYNNIEKNRVILIAGPSSSGKTTFARRLVIQLKVNGLVPVVLSTDDYFVDREKTPLDENGEYDFEAIEAIDLELFNDHLVRLLQGDRVDIPVFNFHRGKREPLGRNLQLGNKQPVIIEGIHSLNDRLTAFIPQDNKYRIFVSALTQLNLDRHNRIPTTDTRIVRRIVRDHRERGHSASRTISWWPGVRRGEEKNIFPYQENADTIFNSALIYELAVLKKHAEPLLREIDESDPGYYQAQRLLRFLQCFYEMPEEDIPRISILREFIGDSCFA